MNLSDKFARAGAYADMELHCPHMAYFPAVLELNILYKSYKTPILKQTTQPMCISRIVFKILPSRGIQLSIKSGSKQYIIQSYSF